MRRRIRNVPRRRGSIVLEAAFSVPLFILLICAMMSSITLVNADLYIQRATENVVSELNVAIPFASNGILCLDDIVSQLGIGAENTVQTEEIDEVLGVIGAISGATGVDLHDVVASAVLGRYVRDRILVEYRKLNDNSSIYDTLLDSASVYLDYNGEEKSIYLTVFYDFAVGSLTVSRSYCTSIALYAESIPLGKGSAGQDSSESVWDQENFERGIALREEFGGNLPYNFPVIGSFDGGEATSIKSLDTTSPYYQEPSNLKKKVRGYIRELYAFEGSNYGGVSVENNEITNKRLLIIVPKNGSQACFETIEELRSYAKECGIDLEIAAYGESHRYIDIE